jgi:Dolichyl-phosphate-mannose-protein mannosyltransferase
VLPSGHVRPTILFALYLVTRLRGIELLPVFLDEILHVRWALLISQGEKPWDATWKWGRALTIWLGALVSPWASDLLLANRLLSLALGALTLWATVEIARRLVGGRAAVLAGVFYVLCPFTLFYDRMALTEAGLSAFTALTVLFSVRLAESGRRVTAALAGLAFALAVCVKALGVLALPVPALVVLVLGPLRARLGGLAVTYAVGLPPAAWAFRSFVATDNAQHMAELFTGGGGAFATRLASVSEGAGWLWVWCTPPLVVLAVAGAGLAVARRDRRTLLLAALAAYPLLAFSAGLSWRMPRYLLPAAVPLLVLAAGTADRLASRLAAWATEGAHERTRAGLSAAIAVVVLLPALRLDHALWTDPARAALPAPDRFQYVLGWPSGYGVRDTEQLVRDELARHPEGLTVVVHANRFQNLRTTPYALALAFAREPRVRLEDWNFADPSAVPAFERWAAAGPGLLVVPRADPQAPAPDPARWSHVASLLARTRKPDGSPCDDVYRLCSPPGCAPSASARP